MLIVEGADLVGKTTFCQALVRTEWCQREGYTYRHLSRLPPKFPRYGGHVALAARRTVQDRFHMSDVVYRIVAGEKQEMTPEAYRLIDARLRLLGAYTVVITADEQLIKERFTRPEMYKLEQVLDANRLYLEIVSHHCWGRDWDAHIHCGRGTSPFPTEADMRIALERYSDRQAQLSRLKLEETET